jgi:hypothetical protein
MSLMAFALVLLSVLGAYAQLQTSGQQACLNGVNKAGAAVVKTQGKEHLACLKGAGKGDVADAQACLTADTKGKVGKARSKTAAASAKSCSPPPSFGYTSVAIVNNSAQQADVDLVADVYGANLQTAVVPCASNKAGCACQQKISKSVEALAAVKLATFVACKKATLKNGATSINALLDCVRNASTAGSIAADTKGKIAKALVGLNAAIVKSCDTPNVTTGAFPGKCTGLAGAPLGTCLDTQVECRVCQAINEMDNLFVNCDSFDNGVLDASCESGSGPTPTPTTTATPTPTATQTYAPGQIFVGAISKTSGLWNYDAVNGLNGGEQECNDHFLGSHVCTFAELEQAEAAVPNQLIGATDVDALPVVDFWAVVPTADINVQCISITQTIRWFYGTAHTNSEGLFATLNNGTGDLSSVQTNTCVGGTNPGGACTTQAQCPGVNAHCGGPTSECAAASRSVGCCVNP